MLARNNTDVFLAGFPKSGTTGLKALTFATLNRARHSPFDANHLLCHCNPHDLVSTIEEEFGRSG